MLEYMTQFNKISDSLYILIPAVIWRDSVFQKAFPEITTLNGSGETNLSLRIEELPNKKFALIIEPATLKRL